MDYEKYLDELVAKLLEDETWELPKEKRVWLKADLAWWLVNL